MVLLLKARKQVNAVRQKAGFAPTAAGLSYEDFKSRLLQERRVEFAFENQRWFDLLRFGKALEVMSAHAGYNRAIVVTDTDLLLPIPHQAGTEY